MLTQHALAVRLRKPQIRVTKYEGGERRLDIVEFFRIARGLDADPLKIMEAFLAKLKGSSIGPQARYATRLKTHQRAERLQSGPVGFDRANRGMTVASRSQIAAKARKKAEADFTTWLMMAKLGGFDELPRTHSAF
jgi:transcriptional regulator with XRE-family HTH domain